MEWLNRNASMSRYDATTRVVAMPEWLRGLTRNQMRFPRVGSNPTGDDLTFIRKHHFSLKVYYLLSRRERQKQSRLPGVEPGIFCSVGRRVAIAPQPLDELQENILAFSSHRDANSHQNIYRSIGSDGVRTRDLLLTRQTLYH